jgi:hypothetical protein
LGKFKTLSLLPPYSPDRYIEAIKTCEATQGVEVLIIDSVTHLWKGTGGLLEYQNSLGGKYQDWAKTTPLYQKWLNAILYSRLHVITTNRKKQAYNMLTDGNKTKVEKAGLDDEIRTGYEYEMTLAFEIINDQHMAKASKDRTQLFGDRPEFVITSETGKQILDWCNEGIDADRELNEVLCKVQSATTVDELIALYKANPQFQEKLLSEFTKRRNQLQTPFSDFKAPHNGTTK